MAGFKVFAVLADELTLRLVEALPERTRNALGDIDNYVDVIISQELTAWQSPWFASFLEYDQLRPEFAPDFLLPWLTEQVRSQ